MNIKQLQVTYQPYADRLLLRISASDGGEFRFWLTRRLVGLLAEPLAKHLQGLPLNDDGADRPEPPGSIENPARQQAEAAFKHQQAVAGLQSEKTFQSPPDQNFPLGEEPLLVAKLGVNPADKGGVVLALHSKDNKGLSVQLGSPLLHGFCDLLVKCSDQASWGLALNLVPPTKVAEPPSKAFH
ncbi:MAG: hypothetical protein JKY89_00550 [Immundisolibacteraceae bacterium]|nr:hypothetical protein [Immundisolibacteraceae bacterium]